MILEGPTATLDFNCPSDFQSAMNAGELKQMLPEPRTWELVLWNRISHEYLGFAQQHVRVDPFHTCFGG